MNRTKRGLKTLSDATLQTTLRRLRNTPTYFLLVWRWSMWLYAFIVVLQYEYIRADLNKLRMAIILLIVSFTQLILVTLYTPIFQILLSRLPHISFLHRRRRYFPAEDEEPDILTPLVITHNRYWNIGIYVLDTLICGLIMYFGGPIAGIPPFGAGSIFYRYGLSAVIGTALTYRTRSAMAAAIGYDLFVLLGIFLPAPDTPHGYIPNIIDIAGSLIDALILHTAFA